MDLLLRLAWIHPDQAKARKAIAVPLNAEAVVLMGFAGALAEVGLPEKSIPLALLFFNIGVEIGQVLFIVFVLAIHRALSKLLSGRFDLTRLAPLQAYAIGGLASYWLFERVSSFWS